MLVGVGPASWMVDRGMIDAMKNKLLNDFRESGQDLLGVPETFVITEKVLRPVNTEAFPVSVCFAVSVLRVCIRHVCTRRTAQRTSRLSSDQPHRPMPLSVHHVGPLHRVFGLAPQPACTAVRGRWWLTVDCPSLVMQTSQWNPTELCSHLLSVRGETG